MKLDLPKTTGNPVIGEAFKIPVTGVGPGSYTLELRALDSAGNEFKRTADFDIE